METAIWPTTAWASVRLLPELHTPDARPSLAATPARLRLCDVGRLMISMPGTDIDAGIADHNAYAASAAARRVDANHKFSTRLGPSASPPV